MSVGLLISPVIGGAVYANTGYYAVYYVAFAIILCNIVLRLVPIEKKVARQWLDPVRDGSDGNATTASPDTNARPTVDGRRPQLEPVRPRTILAVLCGVVAVEAGLV